MLVSVTCPRCRHVYPPGTMHICKGMGDRVRVKPIYDKPDPWASSLPQPDTERTRTLSYGNPPEAPVGLEPEEIRARDPWARARAIPKGGGAHTVARPASVDKAVPRKPTEAGSPRAGAPIVVDGITIDAETLATALHLLEKRRDQQRNYQKRKRSK